MSKPIVFAADARVPPVAGGLRASDTEAHAGGRATAGLLAALVSLPVLLMALSAWSAWRDAWRNAEAEVGQAAEAVAEYGLRVLGAHAVAAGRVDALLHGLSDAEIRAREGELHRELRALVAEMPQAEGAYVIDRDGAVLLSADLLAVPRAPRPAADRDFFLELRADGAPAVHVSRVHTGRLDGSLFFAVSRRRTGAGNADLPPGAFDGLVNLSVYPNRLAEGLRRVVSREGDVASLIRIDGQILARSRGQTGPVQTKPPFLEATAHLPERAMYSVRSVTDGVERLFAARKIEGWPVYGVAGRSRAAIVAEWRRAVAGQFAVGVPATLALLGLAGLIRRGQARLARVNADLEARVAERTAALAASEARLRMALEGAQLGIWELDLRHGTTVRSGQHTPATPDLPLAGVATELLLERTVHPDDLPRVRAALDATRSGRLATNRLEYRVRSAGGEGFTWREVFGGAVQWDPASGAPTKIAGVSRDIAYRKAAEAAIAESECRLREALEAGRVFAFEYRPAADLVQRSPNAGAILGLPESVATHDTGTAFLNAVHPEDRAGLLAGMAGLTPDRPAYAGRFRYRRPDGRTVWLEEKGAAEFGPDGEMNRLTSLSRDVTAEVEAERAARAAQARLREATEGAGLGTYEVDFAHGAAWFDARAVAIVGSGLPVAAWFTLDGPNRAELEARAHPDDRDGFAASWEAVASGAANGWALETRLRRTDGSWTWAWCHGTVVERDPATGGPRRLVGVVQDVTERHRLEAELRQAQKMEALGRLASGIAHDFNNVLQVVAGATTMIERTAARDPDDVRRPARILAEAVSRGSAVTGRLLAFARRGELKVEPVAPAALLAELREMLAPLLGARVAVKVEAAGGLPMLLADRDQLQTAMVNLAINARDAMPRGGTLTLAAAAEVVAEGVPRAPGVPAGLAPGRYLRLSVRDTGAGMAAATLSRVTEPFFTTKPAGEGTGLGLPMAKSLAEQSGGGFAIESSPGRGTAVFLWFPQERGEAVLSVEPAPPAGRVRTGLRVLVVDDEAAVREAVGEQLAAAGLAVRAAAGGDEALALLEAGEPVDALVTNLMMPGLDGLALIREARRRRPGLPAVLLTGQAEDAEALAACGGNGGRFALLHKPVRGPEIATRIADLLSF